MHRFFIDPLLLRASPLALPAALLHQVRDVLRLQPGEQFILLDNSGDETLAEVTAASRAGVAARVIERRSGKAEPAVRITLCQGMIKAARFEWVLEKGTELGVTTFAPVLCQRSMSGLEDAGSAKIQRWQRIIQEAAEQCGRSRLPVLLPARPFAQALDAVPPGALAVLPWENERERALRDAIVPFASAGGRDIFLFIGPEGGFTAEEALAARGLGAQCVTLGPRILRAETAALAAVAVIMGEAGE